MVAILAFSLAVSLVQYGLKEPIGAAVKLIPGDLPRLWPSHMRDASL
jgi:hypothetical protein